ncbi:MAG: DUF2147 domain-containing protein [Opitutales bacterium]
MPKHPWRALIVLLIICRLQGAPVAGDWVAYDEETGNPASVIRLTVNQAGNLEGRIVEILWTPPEIGPNPVCQKCPEPFTDKPLQGLRILWNLEPLEGDSQRWKGGWLLDPRSGNLYRCQVNLDTPDRLELRGYVGLPLFGKTRTWVRHSAADLDSKAAQGGD